MKSVVILIFKKGNRRDCDNYRGISLLNTGYKIFANFIKNRLNKYYDIIGEEQNGFQKGGSCCDGYFTVKILIGKHREFNMETHIAFVDFKKAFDQVNRMELLRILTSDQVPQQTIQNIYNNKLDFSQN
jgi:sorting nexin-29